MTETVETQQGETPANEPAANETFETWITAQDENVRGLYEQHVTGLRSALDNERDARKNAEKSLRELAKTADTNTKAELDRMAEQLGALTAQATFYEHAPAAGVRNMRAAWILAQTDGLVADGKPDFDTLKQRYPELFIDAQPAPRGNAGEGTQAPPAKTRSINDILRS